MHTGGVFQPIIFGALSDITVVLGMRQSIDPTRSQWINLTIW